MRVFSTFARDNFYDKQGNFIEQRNGGPAFFIKQALPTTCVQMVAGDTIDVVARARDDGQFDWSIPSPPTPQIIKSKDLCGDILISTVRDEWHLPETLPADARIFVDVQGYENAAGASTKTRSPIIENLAGRVFCIKGTEDEIALMSPEAIDQQRKLLLIETLGTRGVKLWLNNELMTIKPESIIKPCDTVGAGDTWFANFVYQMSLGESVETSAQIAMRKTSAFLAKK